MYALKPQEKTSVGNFTVLVKIAGAQRVAVVEILLTNTKQAQHYTLGAI